MKFTYRNHRGEITERHIEPVALVYDMSAHPEYGYMQPAWYLQGVDQTRNVTRSFKLDNIVIPSSAWVKPYALLLPERFGLPIS